MHIISQPVENKGLTIWHVTRITLPAYFETSTTMVFNSSDTEAIS
ncbi:hypothetical Protein YC6258_01364 [Gynuella sunshinyii YC6258]|uniref:Uncharacterized protein n=1 Tax=Gynuella sunshinyii YC6258 TaxID=1445510 RepID=A0A0C5VFQ6_9GAMM|nr:hypothetical Protein YC6258_01364 [Gynuella sunshinyii YC6258]